MNSQISSGVIGNYLWYKLGRNIIRGKAKWMMSLNELGWISSKNKQEYNH